MLPLCKWQKAYGAEAGARRSAAARVAAWACILLATLTAISGQASAFSSQEANESNRFLAVVDAHWKDFLTRNPLQATALGYAGYAAEVGSLSVEAMDDSVLAARRFAAALADIRADSLTRSNRVNYRALQTLIARQIESGENDGRLMLLSPRGSWPMTFARVMSASRIDGVESYRNYLGRLKKYAGYNLQGIDTLRLSVKRRVVLQCSLMPGVQASVESGIRDGGLEGILLAPLKAARNIPPEVEAPLYAEAVSLIRDSVLPAYRTLAAYVSTEYAPNCVNGDGLSAIPGARDYYQSLVRAYTSSDLSSDAFHEIGLGEVERLRREMETAKDKAGFSGSLQEFIAFLREDQRFYPSSEEDLLRYAAYLSKKADGILPSLFATLPRLPYTLRPIQERSAASAPPAYYGRPPADGKQPGIYWINVTQLDQRPLYEMEALTLHEAVPGHHLQRALMLEQGDLPDFRKHAVFTDFTEGWALYAERLGIGNGFYEDPYTLFGLLSNEMWRACRLVVDTGLHAKGWSRADAVDYLLRNTALSRHTAEQEVERYITLPGQALSYKAGEMAISQMRKDAESALGATFDIRAFHDAILAHGPLPVGVLRAEMRQWVEDAKDKRPALQIVGGGG